MLGTLIVFRRAGPDSRRMIVFLLGTYLVFSLMAALGTTTVGTAMRHHLKVFWIIVAIGAPAVLARSGGLVNLWASPPEADPTPGRSMPFPVPPVKRRSVPAPARDYGSQPAG